MLGVTMVRIGPNYQHHWTLSLSLNCRRVRRGGEDGGRKEGEVTLHFPPVYIATLVVDLWYQCTTIHIPPTAMLYFENTLWLIKMPTSHILINWPLICSNL